MKRKTPQHRRPRRPETPQFPKSVTAKTPLERRKGGREKGASWRLTDPRDVGIVALLYVVGGLQDPVDVGGPAERDRHGGGGSKPHAPSAGAGVAPAVPRERGPHETLPVVRRPVGAPAPGRRHRRRGGGESVFGARIPKRREVA